MNAPFGLTACLLLALQLSIACGGDDSSGPDDTADAAQSPGQQTPANPRQPLAGDTLPTADGAASTDSMSDAGLPAHATGDARVRPTGAADSGSGSDAALAQCLEPGSDCAAKAGTCCPDATCVSDSVAMINVCAAVCTEDADCVSGCCAPVGGGAVHACAPASYCVPVAGPASPPVSAPSGCGTLEVIASDGTYLGVASSGLGAESVCNTYGPYGSTTSATSIFSTYGQYGGAYGVNSAYNKYSVNPPALVCSGNADVVALVSKNAYAASPSIIDPDDLCGVLQANGL